MTDVYLRKLSDEAYDGLRKLCMDKDWDGMFNPWITLEIAAAFVFRLAEVEDHPHWFPKGKWATIQKLEELCEMAARAEAR